MENGRKTQSMNEVFEKLEENKSVTVKDNDNLYFQLKEHLQSNYKSGHIEGQLKPGTGLITLVPIKPLLK